MMSWNPTLPKLQSVRSSEIVNSRKPHVNSEWVDEDWLSYVVIFPGFERRKTASQWRSNHCAGWLGILGASMASILEQFLMIRAEGQNLPITRGMMLWPIPILRRDTRADLDPLRQFKQMRDMENPPSLRWFSVQGNPPQSMFQVRKWCCKLDMCSIVAVLAAYLVCSLHGIFWLTGSGKTLIQHSQQENYIYMYGLPNPPPSPCPKDMIGWLDISGSQDRPGSQTWQSSGRRSEPWPDPIGSTTVYWFVKSLGIGPPEITINLSYSTGSL